MKRQVDNSEAEPEPRGSLGLYHEAQADGVPYTDTDIDEEEPFGPATPVKSE